MGAALPFSYGPLRPFLCLPSFSHPSALWAAVPLCPLFLSPPVSPVLHKLEPDDGDQRRLQEKKKGKSRRGKGAGGDTGPNPLLRGAAAPGASPAPAAGCDPCFLGREEEECVSV